jgi:ribosomal protein S18 acetylase RimI-like enzyme
VIEVRVLDPVEIEVVGDALGLARLHQGNGFYLVAWQGDEPVGHLHLALTDPPEIQDVQVSNNHRRRGVATRLICAAEEEASARGLSHMRVSVGVGNEAAQALYRSCGYADVGLEPQHVKGTIKIRTGPIEVDEVLVTWEKTHLTG